MISKLLFFCLVISYSCNSQIYNSISKSLVGKVGFMCIEMKNPGCAGEEYFLELIIDEKNILIKQKSKKTITCKKYKITYKNLGRYLWKESNGKILLENKSTNSKYTLISLENKENRIIGRVKIYGKIKEVIFKEINYSKLLKSIKKIPYIENCNDTVFWKLVNNKNNIPLLINELANKTLLKGVYVPNFGGEYTIADVSLIILKEKIKDIPILDIIDIEFNKNCGYCSYWNFVRKNNKNRLYLKYNFKKWFEINRNKLKWVDANQSMTGNCTNSLTKGHYEIKEK